MWREGNIIITSFTFFLFLRGLGGSFDKCIVYWIWRDDCPLICSGGMMMWFSRIKHVERQNWPSALSMTPSEVTSTGNFSRSTWNSTILWMGSLAWCWVQHFWPLFVNDWHVIAKYSCVICTRMDLCLFSEYGFLDSWPCFTCSLHEGNILWLSSLFGVLLKHWTYLGGRDCCVFHLPMCCKLTSKDSFRGGRKLCWL